VGEAQCTPVNLWFVNYLQFKFNSLALAKTKPEQAFELTACEGKAAK
jgi:hypothetical protein